MLCNMWELLQTTMSAMKYCRLIHQSEKLQYFKSRNLCFKVDYLSVYIKNIYRHINLWPLGKKIKYILMKYDSFLPDGQAVIVWKTK